MMAFLLDTNVISEPMRRRPDARVVSWLVEQTVSDLFLAAMTIGELVRGARRLGGVLRRGSYERWIEQDLMAQFEGRILAFDQAAAVIWGEIMGDGDRIGRPRPAVDAQIGAVARRHGLTLATRNVGDFEGMGARLFDPWSSGSSTG